MKAEKIKLLNSIISLSYLSLAIIVIGFVILLVSGKEQVASESAAFCGTVSIENNLAKTDSLYSTFIQGKVLFKSNCASCHNKNMMDDMTGPALAGVVERWQNYPTSDLMNWIRNSQKMIEENHPKALEVWNDWAPSIMTSFPNLSDSEISAIIVYVEEQATF